MIVYVFEEGSCLLHNNIFFIISRKATHPSSAYIEMDRHCLASLQLEAEFGSIKAIGQHLGARWSSGFMQDCQGPRVYPGQGRNLERVFCSKRTAVPPLGPQHRIPEPDPSLETHLNSEYVNGRPNGCRHIVRKEET